MPKAQSAEEKALRQGLVDSCLWMNASGINQGTSGNVSARCGDAMLITPSGVPYDQMKPEDIAVLPFGGDYGEWTGPLRPSTEWRFHFDIMASRPDVGAIVHTHSTYATTLACARKEIPALHYMIAAAGGPSIRCADYATFGTKELSDNALVALQGRTCCLLANHGMIATGANLAKARWLAMELETIARQYYLSLCIGGPVLLSDAEIMKNVELFASYGPRPKEAASKPKAKRKSAKRAKA